MSLGYEIPLEHILAIIETYIRIFHFFGFSIGPYEVMQKFRTPVQGDSRIFFFS